MNIPRAIHSWSVSPRRAMTIQSDLAPKVLTTGSSRKPKIIAGVDLAFEDDGDTCVAGTVVWSMADREVLEQRVVRRPCRFPYVPGLLSFREAPAIIECLRRIRTEPDVLMFDGQGYAHPRRFGLACHVGLLVDRPSLGVAKGILCGSCRVPGERRGSATRIVHGGETIGVALRTRERVKPVYVSIGHRVSLAFAARIALAACTRFRLPEPTRLADRLVADAKRGV